MTSLRVCLVLLICVIINVGLDISPVLARQPRLINPLSPSLAASSLFCLAKSGDASKFNCSKCRGVFTIRPYFVGTTSPRTVAAATAELAFKRWVGDCATGGDMGFAEWFGRGCDGAKSPKDDCYGAEECGYCTYWSVEVTTWRWCGNRPNLSNPNWDTTRDIGPEISARMTWTASCWDAVQCHGNCLCSVCSC